MEHRRYISLSSWAAERRQTLDARAAANVDALFARLSDPLPEDAPPAMAADREDNEAVLLPEVA